MASEEIPIGEQWDAFVTLRKLDEIDQMVREFISHTLRTLSTPRQVDTPFGPQVLEDELVHPLGNFLGVIDACRRGCYASYGQQRYEQFALFEEQVSGGATEAGPGGEPKPKSFEA